MKGIILSLATLISIILICQPFPEYICANVYVPRAEKANIVIASWYDYDINGIEWSKNHRTAASRDLPRYSMARVTNIENGKSVEVYINDYGPEEWTGRDIDLSSYAFSRIADLSLGLANVKIELLN
ncbi:MAG TPA: septal ring lytic transglycosylase RlpA family protein [Syntrophales bacterium]|nr:septal ring lytic transglycosylase RlpA family protein [Syntrophales bacterium]